MYLSLSLLLLLEKVFKVTSRGLKLVNKHISVHIFLFDLLYIKFLKVKRWLKAIF